jgi:hypothetical protein
MRFNLRRQLGCPDSTQLITGTQQDRTGSQELTDTALGSRRDCFRWGIGAAAAGISLYSSLGALQAESTQTIQPKSVAAIITVYYPNSHADVILTKLLEGWKHDGGPGPALKLSSVYIDQPEGSQFGLEILDKHQIPRFDTIEQAITLGGNSVAVDGVLSIGEHGKYPINELGQQLYPRKRFFQEITETFEKYHRVVPVFNDKHISTVWEEALWMYQRSIDLKVPLMSGSSLPVSYRTSAFDLPMGCDLESAVGIGYSGLDIYGFHALEVYQSMVEKRTNAEQGVRWVRCLEGPAVWEAVDNGWVDADVLNAVYEAIPKTFSSIREDDQAVLFQFEYTDGFRGSLLMLPSAQLTGVGVRLKGQSPVATAIEERPEPRYPHFAFLLKAIEKMMHSGQPTYPVERTLLTGGILDRALHSKLEKGKKIVTPELAIAYRPVDYPHAPMPDLLLAPQSVRGAPLKP